MDIIIVAIVAVLIFGVLKAIKLALRPPVVVGSVLGGAVLAVIVYVAFIS